MEWVAVLDQDIKREFSNKESVVSVFWDICISIISPVLLKMMIDDIFWKVERAFG